VGISSPRTTGRVPDAFGLTISDDLYRIDGVGPREKRPKRPEPAWLTQESNQFGTDEFMKYCEIVGAEPYLALNFGTGTLDEGQARESLEFGSLLTSHGNSFGLGGILQL
jgi:alpha-L-arabinofuranosidase